MRESRSRQRPVWPLGPRTMLEETLLRPPRANFQIWFFSGSSSSLKYYRAPNGARIRNGGFALIFIRDCATGIWFFSGSVPAARRAACMMYCDLQYKMGAGQPVKTQSVFSLTRGCGAQCCKRESGIVHCDCIWPEGHWLRWQRGESAPTFCAKHGNGSKLSSS